MSSNSDRQSSTIRLNPKAQLLCLFASIDSDKLRYYENTDLENAELVPASHVETRRYQIDADQLSTGKQSRS